jgi:hypothetical protein
MMTKPKFQAVINEIRDTSQVPRAPDLHYQCLKCGKTVPSQPDDSIGCDCDNIFIDVDHHRLSVRDFKLFQLLRRVES